MARNSAKIRKTSELDVNASTKMTKATLIFPHQLFAEHPAVDQKRPVILLEDALFFGQDKHWPLHFHKQKLILHRASMKAYEAQLSGIVTRYLDWQPESTLGHQLAPFTELEEIHLADPVDDLLERRLKRFAEQRNIRLVYYETPNFLTTQEVCDELLGSKKPFMATFYKAQRQRLNILMEPDGKSPMGGKWSYDEENRKKLPKKIRIPEPPSAPHNEYTLEAISYVSERFPQARGSAHGFCYPIDHASALAWLENFLVERFHLFGDYEDAISTEHRTIFHSVLTPALNIGLITPALVVERALAVGEENKIPLNSLEGFIRQIIGWREFMRAMYVRDSVMQRTKNYWQFEHKPMPQAFYNGTTGIAPIDDTIQRALEDSYCHHIERLMLVGNFMLLCRIHPDEVYKWFMELFIDAYDWVMVPNVYGMSQFADGGTFTTKPYISGSNYVRKMSNYKKDDWCDTWDALFWTFISDHHETFARNPRMSRMTWMYDKMTQEKKDAHRSLAHDFLNSL